MSTVGLPGNPAFETGNSGVKLPLPNRLGDIRKGHQICSIKVNVMKCRDVMTPTPSWCVPSNSALQVARLMKSEDIGAVPVCESLLSNRVVGIVTDRDLALEVVAEGREPDHTRVRDVMTNQPHVCHPDDDVEEALNVMEEYQVRRMPVVDVTDRLVGIISFSP